MAHARVWAGGRPALLLLAMVVRCCSAERPCARRPSPTGRPISGQSTVGSEALAAAVTANDAASRW